MFINFKSDFHLNSEVQFNINTNCMYLVSKRREFRMFQKNLVKQFVGNTKNITYFNTFIQI